MTDDVRVTHSYSQSSGEAVAVTATASPELCAALQGLSPPQAQTSTNEGGAEEVAIGSKGNSENPPTLVKRTASHPRWRKTSCKQRTRSKNCRDASVCSALSFIIVF